MKINNKIPPPALRKQVISMAVLVGLLCILFHPFTHLSLDLFVSQDDVHQTEHLHIALSNQSSEQHNDHAECPECILKKHVQIDLFQSVSLNPNDLCRFVTVYQHSLYNHFAYLLYNLRGPPSNAV
jgi:hypothetical protein